MKNQIMYVFYISLLWMTACSNPAKQTTADVNQQSAVEAGNYLTMKINGKEWSADHDIFGAFHPEGYNKAIIIAGASGKKDKSEKAFNINIYNTNGIGNYAFASGNADLSVAQMGNWTDQDYICGSMMGFDVNVKITKVSKSPAVVEATFSGTLTCPSGPALVITDGKFSYHE